MSDILIVDDERDIRELIADILGDEGFQTRTAANADEALAAMTCEVDADNIDVEDDGSFDLDDVICADGQYDIKLNADFTEKERRKE